jgi:hypothetical protein
MSPTFTPEPRPLARHTQRPWRPVQSDPRTPSATVIRAFATPVVRELPPRREQLAAAGTW